MRFIFIALALLVATPCLAVQKYYKTWQGTVYELRPEVPPFGLLAIDPQCVQSDTIWVPTESGCWKGMIPDAPVPSTPPPQCKPVPAAVPLPPPIPFQESAEARLLKTHREGLERQALEIKADADKRAAAMDITRDVLKVELDDRQAKMRAMLLAVSATVVDVGVSVSVPFVAPAAFLASAMVIGKALSEMSVDTPHGTAVQDESPEAMKLRQEVAEGKTLHKIGKRGKSFTGGDSQFWSPDHPLTTEGYADKMGMPDLTCKDGMDFLEKGKVKPGKSFVTKPAVGLDGQAGGGMEVVVEPGGVQVESHSSL